MEEGNPDRQKVLTYRQVDARVHSNTSVHNLWLRARSERVNSIYLPRFNYAMCSPLGVVFLRMYVSYVETLTKAQKFYRLFYYFF